MRDFVTNPYKKHAVFHRKQAEIKAFSRFSCVTGRKSGEAHRRLNYPAQAGHETHGTEQAYAQNRTYREQHKDEINARRRMRRNGDKARVAEQNRNYYLKHAEALKEYQRKYRAEHREEINARRRKSAVFNPEVLT